MTSALQIHQTGVAGSSELEPEIERRFDRLARYSDEIQRCQVWIEAPHGHHLRGRLYEVRIRITVPDEEIVVEDQPQGDDPRVLLRESFRAARRQLQDYVRRRRRDVARHRGARRRPREGGF
jgi:Sigma 54 modulation protein / S30EA ribosomal protein